MEGDEKMKLYDFIISRLPDIDGYGACGRVYDEDGVSNHSVFKESIREDHEGDIGIFLTSNSDITNMHGRYCFEAEAQIVVNTVGGDVDGALDYLFLTMENIKTKYRDDHIWIKNLRLVNCLPVGKNSSGIHWCTLNFYIKYLVNDEN